MNYSIHIAQNHTNMHISQPQVISSPIIQKKCMQTPFKPKKSKVKISSFSWNRVEERKYISFLKANGRLFSLSAKERTQIKINVMMSCAVKSRTSSQCHSHHQKMIVKYGSIEAIIQNHAFLYPKEKTDVDARIVNNQIVVQPNQLIYNSPQEKPTDEDNKYEPIWWRYLDLVQNDDEAYWGAMDFFTQ